MDTNKNVTSSAIEKKFMNIKVRQNNGLKLLLYSNGFLVIKDVKMGSVLNNTSIRNDFQKF